LICWDDIEVVIQIIRMFRVGYVCGLVARRDSEESIAATLKRLWKVVLSNRKIRANPVVQKCLIKGPAR